MKKTLFALAAMILALTFAPMCALAAQGDAIIARGDFYINQVLAMDDSLVLYDFNKIYVYQIGDADMRALEVDRTALDEAYGTEGYVNIVALYADDGGLHALSALHGENDVPCAVFSDIQIGEETAKHVNVRKTEWPEALIERYDDSSYAMSIQEPVCAGGCLCFMTYAMNGEMTLALDLETMQVREIPEQDANTMMIVPYSEGRVLIVGNDYNRRSLVFQVYDPAADVMGERFEMSREDYSISGFACDPETGRVFGVYDGEVCEIDIAGGKLGEGLTDMPLTVFSNRAGLIFAEKYYVYSASEGVVVRNLEPETQPTTRLKVCDTSWDDVVTDAYFAFVNTHGDTAVTISHDSSGSDEIIEGMMNRDDSVDVYIMSTNYSPFEALRDRGFLAELDDETQISAMMEEVYPSVREYLSRDGHIVAMPTSVDAWGTAVNERALEKLGLTVDDVPTNWLDFLDFLSGTLTERWSDATGVTFYFDGMTADDMKTTLFSQIWNDYEAYAEATMDTVSYDTELLRALLEKLNAIDFTAFGLEERRNNNGGVYFVGGVSGESSQLFEFGNGVALGNRYLEDGMHAFLMSMDADAPKIMQLQVSVAVVNPFSKNLGEAVAFVGEIANQLPEAVRYNLNPALNEPVRRKNYEESLASAQEYYDDAQKQLEEAAPADRQAFEETLKYAQDWLYYEEKQSWEISAEDIEWYRANDDCIEVARRSWLYSDSDGEAAELLQQYLDHQIGLDQVLSRIDKKVRMMQMESQY